MKPLTKPIKSRARITLASFFAYFVMSGVLAPIGIVSASMAEHFGLTQTAMTSRFGWLTFGILIGAGLAVPLLHAIRLRPAMITCYGLIAGALVALGFVDSVLGVQWLFGLVGMGCGVGLAAAASTISRSYDDRARASALVVTDGFFSIAGFLCAALATYLVQQSLPWSWVYAFVGAVAAAVVGLAVMAEFPEVQSADTATPQRFGAWPWTAWCCLFALGLYTLGQSCVLLWLPTHAQQGLGLAQGEAGALVGQFWLGMLGGQLLVALVVLGLGVRMMVGCAITGTLLGSISLWAVGTPSWLWLLVVLWGIGNLGLLKLVISLAAQLTPTPQPSLLSGLLFGATAGTALGPWVSSQLVEAGGAIAALRFGSGAYAGVFVLISAVLFAQTQQKRAQQRR